MMGVKWYVPLLNRLPRDHKFALGDRIVLGLYLILQGLIIARYFTIRVKTYEYASKQINEIGQELRGGIKPQMSLSFLSSPWAWLTFDFLNCIKAYQ